jgi:hypothetical protein
VVHSLSHRLFVNFSGLKRTSSQIHTI